MSGKIDGGGCDVLQRTKMEVMGMFDERRGQIKGEEGEGELMWFVRRKGKGEEVGLEIVVFVKR